MRSLNLDQLRTLIEVVDLGSFSAAARRLNLTQPAVSLQIRELELRFGIKLVERLGRTTHATVPGQELIEHGRRILRECDIAASGMQRFRNGWIGRVHVGTTNTALMYELPAVLRRLRQDHAGIDLQVSNMPTCDTVEGIIQNKLDLGLVTLPVDETHLRVTPLRDQMLVAILPADTPDIPDRITPEYFARHPMVLEHTRGAVYALVMQWLARELPLPLAPMHLGTVEAMKKVVGLGMGMSIVPDVAALADPTPDIVVRPLDPPAPSTLALAEHRCKPNEPALELVRNALLGLKAAPQIAETPCNNRGTVMFRPRPVPVAATPGRYEWSPPRLTA